MDKVIESPCVRNCCLNDDDVCLGCRRTLHEIMHWQASTNEEKLAILKRAEARLKSQPN
jgi:uncharacterized protein